MRAILNNMLSVLDAQVGYRVEVKQTVLEISHLVHDRILQAIEVEASVHFDD